MPHLESSVRNPDAAPFGINSAGAAFGRFARYLYLAMAAVVVVLTYIFEQIWP